jgi:hypothetical protein
MDISTQFQQTTIFVNDNGFIAPLEKMTAALSLNVDIGRVWAVEVMHDFAQIFTWGFNEQMVWCDYVVEDL